MTSCHFSRLLAQRLLGALMAALLAVAPGVAAADIFGAQGGGPEVEKSAPPCHSSDQAEEDEGAQLPGHGCCTAA